MRSWKISFSRLTSCAVRDPRLRKRTHVLTFSLVQNSYIVAVIENPTTKIGEFEKHLRDGNDALYKLCERASSRDQIGKKCVEQGVQNGYKSFAD